MPNGRLWGNKKPKPPLIDRYGLDSGLQQVFMLLIVSLSGDLNPRPANYESAALPTELKRHEIKKSG